MTNRGSRGPWLAALWLAAACAQPSAPPGGDPDRTPPALVGLEPSPGEVLAGWDREVVFRFDERLSEKGIARAISVSPAGLELDVERDGSEIRVRPERGWPRDRVIHVELSSEVQDLFGNRRTEPVRLVFSTGPPIPQNALGGVVVDRLTGRPVAGARVDATFGVQDATYATNTDSAGVFALAELPAGSYAVAAYQDRNRNASIDFGEMEARARVGLQPTDTLVLELALLPADTTPANVTRAEAADSLRITVSLDDYLDPEASLQAVRAEVYALPDSTPLEVVEVLHSHELTAREASAEAAAARAEADTADIDTLRLELPVDTAAPAAADTTPPGGRPSRQSPAPDSAVRAEPVPQDTDVAVAAPAAAADPLPSRDLVLTLERPLRPGVRYRVVARGITNIRGVLGGGGTAEFEAPRPPAPPAPDSAAVDVVPPDTASLPARPGPR